MAGLFVPGGGAPTTNQTDLANTTWVLQLPVTQPASGWWLNSGVLTYAAASGGSPAGGDDAAFFFGLH